MRGKLEQSVPVVDHGKLRTQKMALEKLCRVLQAENKELRKQLPETEDTDKTGACTAEVTTDASEAEKQQEDQTRDET